VKNKLADLNEHLFAQLERLSDEGLTPEQLDREHKRGEAIVAVADQIIKNANLKIAAAKIIAERGGDPMVALGTIEGRTVAALAAPGANGKAKTQ
jgi:hypothetical protein